MIISAIVLVTTPTPGSKHESEERNVRLEIDTNDNGLTTMCEFEDTRNG